MPALKRPRWEAYCRLRASGETQEKSYIGAKFTGKHAWTSATKLEKRKEIRERIQELMPSAKACREVTATIRKEWVIAELLRLAKVSESKEKYDTARQCIKNIAEIIGLYNKGSRIKFDWSGNPEELNDEQLETLFSYIEELSVGKDQARKLRRERLGIGGDVTIEVPVVVEQEPEW